MLLKPFFRLDALSPQKDQVDEHHKENDHNNDRDGDLDTKSALAASVCRGSELQGHFLSATVIDGVKGELCERALA